MCEDASRAFNVLHDSLSRGLTLYKILNLPKVPPRLKKICIVIQLEP